MRGGSKLLLEDYLGAIEDFNEVLKINPYSVNAFYGRGIAKIFLGQKDSGCLDLSKAGELGNEPAYEAIKKYCN